MSGTRTRRILGWGLLTLGLTPPVFAGDFNPRGRKRPPAAAPAAPQATPRQRATPDPPAAARTAASDKGSWDALVERYRSIVLTQPAAPFPLQRLAQLYRDRDGSLDELLRDFEQRAASAGPGQWSARVALAGLYREAGKVEQAIAGYEAVIADRPAAYEPLLALAQLHTQAGNKPLAKARLEQALPLLKTDSERDQTLRELMTLSLDLSDFDAAKAYHERLVTRAQGSSFARAELGRELLTRREFARAEAELRRLVEATRGDNRARAPALRDLGRALIEQQKHSEALGVLERALQAAGQQSGLVREILEWIARAYRAEGRLPELIALLERGAATDFEKRRLLGDLYEETGRIEQALQAHQAALSQQPADVDLRLRVIRLLQLQGDLAGAIKQYEKLIQAAPRQTEFVFQLADALLQHGQRDEALGRLRRLEARPSDQDNDTLMRLVEFYERVGESARALNLLQQLAAKSSNDPEHVIELGARYYAQGDEVQAERVWQRMLQLSTDRARGYHQLGEVYLQHDMAEKALSALQKAIELEPGEAQYQRAYAIALERTGSAASARSRNHHYQEAQRVWNQLLRAPGSSEALRRESRQHIVTLWSLTGTLRERLRPLAQRLELDPPDLEAGRLLVESYLRLQDYGRAERALRSIIRAAPGDGSSHLQLERSLVAQRKLAEAIEVLQRLVQIEPGRAREFYQRMATHASELYQDERALQYATRAVELSPDDADGHRKLGEMQRRKQNTRQAIAEFRQALSKNDRLFPVYFDLAELLVNEQQLEEADQLLRRVIQASPDEELVARAARLSMHLNLGAGTLDTLEAELLPLALSHPDKPLYRRILVEIYGAIAFPLIQKAQQLEGEDRQLAVEALRRLGSRAVKPLLDTLADKQSSGQQVAVELLTHLQHRGAGPALLAFATGDAEAQLRTRAMLAVAQLRDPNLLDRLQPLVFAGEQPSVDEADPVAVAAALALVTLETPTARHLSRQLLTAPSESVRALAALSLSTAATINDRSMFLEMVRSPDEGHLGRAAAAYALGQAGAKEHTAGLEPLAEDADPRVRTAALVALARLKSPEAPRLIARGLSAESAAVRHGALGAARVLATGNYRPKTSSSRQSERVDVEAMLDERLPGDYPESADAHAITLLEPTLREAVSAATQSSPQRAATLATLLLARPGRPAFGELSARLDLLPEDQRQAAENSLEAVAAAAVPGFLALLQHPSAEVRVKATRVLGTRPEPTARTAVIQALRDQEPSVQRAALNAVEQHRSADAVANVVLLCTSDQPWPMRARAATVLQQLYAAAPASVRPTLETLGTQDPNAFVREAALTALFRASPARAEALLLERIKDEPEARVRSALQQLLQELPHPVTGLPEQPGDGK